MRLENTIWLGDVAAAFHALRPADPHAHEAIARLLGFAWARKAPTPGPRTEPSPEGGLEEPPEEPRAGTGTDREAERLPAEPSVPPDVADRSEEIPIELEPVKSEAVLPPVRWQAVVALDRVEERHTRLRLPFEPLLAPSGQRELATALAAVRLPIGAIDERYLVRAAAEGQPVRQVPRRRRWTVCRGVQVLIDLGVGMEPFRRDQAELAAVLRAAIGPERVEVVRCHEVPGAIARPGRRRPRSSYRPPAPGVPVIVLSDLGLGGEPRVPRGVLASWAAFAERMSQQQTRVVALVPYPPEIWDPTTRPALRRVYWNRTTTISRLLTLLRFGAD